MYLYCLSVSHSKNKSFWDKRERLTKTHLGKVELGHAAALYEFVKDSPLQKMIHELKYEENQELESI